jgi:hypothetical protein
MTSVASGRVGNFCDLFGREATDGLGVEPAGQHALLPGRLNKRFDNSVTIITRTFVF